MVRRITRVCAVSFGLASLCASVQAAELTDVVDAFDDENQNPFDLHIEPSFTQRIERGRITREAACQTSAGGCGELPALTFNREAEYKRVINTIGFDFQIGLARDLEFHVNLPIVVGDTRTLEYADGVNRENSTIYPSAGRVAADLDPQTADLYGEYFGTYTLFNIPNDGRSRSGIGDVTLGIAWAPFNDQRANHFATLRVGVDYVAPSGTPARATNDGVGRGVHELLFSVAASRRLATWFDPYFGLDVALPFPSGSGLFESHPNSTRTGPGARFHIQSGTEIVMAENRERQSHYSFDLGVGFGYQLEGRDYSPLFDALANSSCNGRTPTQVGYGNDGPDGNAYNPPPGTSAEDAACAWVVQQPGNAEPRANTALSNTPYRHDGITDVEGYSSVGGHVGFNLQFNKYVEFRFRTRFDWDSPHYLTMANSGRDANNDDVVDLDPTPTTEEVERNPFYNPTLDAVGRRFRFENAVNIQWGMTLAVMF